MGKQSHRTQSLHGLLARYDGSFIGHSIECLYPLGATVRLQHLASVHSRLNPTFPVMSRILEEDVVLSGYNVPANVSNKSHFNFLSAFLVAMVTGGRGAEVVKQSVHCFYLGSGFCAGRQISGSNLFGRR